MMIEQTHHAQKQDNLAILNFVNQRGSASFAELYAALVADPTPSMLKRFRKKIDYLVWSEQLQASGYRSHRVLVIGPRAGQIGGSRRLGAEPMPQAQAAPEPIDTAPVPEAAPGAHLVWHSPVVPPRRFDALRAPVWVPPPSNALRAGADDHKRYASRGDRC